MLGEEVINGAASGGLAPIYRRCVGDVRYVTRKGVVSEVSWLCSCRLMRVDSMAVWLSRSRATIIEGAQAGAAGFDNPLRLPPISLRDLTCCQR